MSVLSSPQPGGPEGRDSGLNLLENMVAATVVPSTFVQAEQQLLTALYQQGLWGTRDPWPEPQCQGHPSSWLDGGHSELTHSTCELPKDGEVFS